MRKLKMMVLDNVVSHDKKVDLKKLDYKDWENKLLEESVELQDALNSKDKIKMAEEVLDVIQVCIGIIAKIVREGIRIDFILLKHNKKLINRGCKESAIIEFNMARRY